MNDLFSLLANRLKQASTWASIAALLAALHIGVDPGLWKDITVYGTVIAGALGVIIDESKSKTNTAVAADVINELITGVIAAKVSQAQAPQDTKSASL